MPSPVDRLLTLCKNDNHEMAVRFAQAVLTGSEIHDTTIDESGRRVTVETEHFVGEYDLEPIGQFEKDDEIEDTGLKLVAAGEYRLKDDAVEFSFTSRGHRDMVESAVRDMMADVGGSESKQSSDESAETPDVGSKRGGNKTRIFGGTFLSKFSGK